MPKRRRNLTTDVRGLRKRRQAVRERDTRVNAQFSDIYPAPVGQSRLEGRQTT